MLRRRRQLAELIPQDRKRRPMLDVVVADPNKVATVLRRGYLAYLIHVQQREISTRMQSWQARRSNPLFYMGGLSRGQAVYMGRLGSQAISILGLLWWTW